MFNFIPKDYRISTVVCCIIIFLTSIFEAIGLSLIFPLLDSIFNNDVEVGSYIKFLRNLFNYKIENELSIVLLLIFIAFLLKFVFVILRNYKMYGLELNIRSYWIKGITRFHSYSKETIDKSTVGQITSQLTNECLKAASAYRQILEFISQVSLITVLVSIMLIANIKAATFVLSFIVVLLLILRKFLFFYGSKLSVARFKTENDFFQIIGDVTAGLPTIKSLNKENFTVKRLEKKLHDFISTMKKIETIVRLPMPITELSVVFIFVSSLFVVTGIMNLDINNHVPTLGLFSILLFRISTYAGALSSQLMTIQNLKPSIVSVHSIANQGYNIVYKENLKLIDTSIHVDIDKIFFNYLHDDYLFEDFSTSIKRNEITFIQGKSGKGKSTLLKLILGEYKLKDGSINFYGKDKRKYSTNDYQFISYVSQESFFYNDTILINLTFEEDKNKIDYEYLEKCIKISCCDKIIENTKDGLLSIMEERGNNFSGGQKARLSLTRALYLNPKLLLIDEIFSSLEEEISIKIIDNLNSIKKDTSVVIVNHHHNLSKYADNIITL